MHGKNFIETLSEQSTVKLSQVKTCSDNHFNNLEATIVLQVQLDKILSFSYHINVSSVAD